MNDGNEPRGVRVHASHKAAIGPAGRGSGLTRLVALSTSRVWLEAGSKFKHRRRRQRPGKNERRGTWQTLRPRSSTSLMTRQLHIQITAVRYLYSSSGSKVKCATDDGYINVMFVCRGELSPASVSGCVIRIHYISIPGAATVRLSCLYRTGSLL